MHNQDTLCEEEIEPHIEWLSISVTKCIVGNNEATLAKLQRNMQLLTLKSVGILSSAKVETLAAVAFYKLLCSVKFAIVAVHESLCTLMFSNIHLFREFFIESEGKVMQPIALCMLITSKTHLDKTVIFPRIGMCVSKEKMFFHSS